MSHKEIQLKKELINSVINLITLSKITTITFKTYIVGGNLDFTQYEIEMNISYKENNSNTTIIKKVRFQEENISSFEVF